jgi:phosphohistidine phosphatase
MKHLYLIRHAKSSWSNPLLDDFDRPLNKRGENDAPFMANILLRQHISPNIILSSPAKRAKTTAEIFAHTLGYSKKIVWNKDLYLTSPKTLLNILHTIPHKYNTVFIFGHNPEFTEFANSISSKTIENIPTCGIVGFELNIKEWNELCKETSSLICFEFPKKHKKFVL